MNDKKAMDAVAYTIESYPNNGFLANVGIMDETIPKAGSIKM